MNIEIKILDKELYKVEKMGGTSYSLPQYATDGSAAIDLISTDNMILEPEQKFTFGTGIAIHIKDSNVAALALPRSGLGTRGLVLMNGTGLIDSDYQGELTLCMVNQHPTRNIQVLRGDKIAQLLFIPIVRPRFSLVNEFSETTERGTGGFGSTGS